MSKLRVFSSLVVVSLLAAAVAWADAPSNIGGMRQDEKNESRIRALYDDFEAAWNRHDVAALVALWTIDGDHVEPDGTEADGQEAIEGLLNKQHGSIFKDSMLDLAIADVWFVTSTVALVDGTYTLGGAKLPDGEDMPSRTGRYTAVLLEERAGWLVAASRLMIPTQLPYKPE
jgi:uncharacterized protein (TIGR02246 family)